MGFTSIRSALQIDSMDAELRNSIWNILDEMVFGALVPDYGNLTEEPYYSFYRSFWSEFFKEPVRDMPDDWHYWLSAVNTRYGKFPWYKVYDFCEFTVQRF